MFRQKTWNSHYKFPIYSIKGGRLVYGYGKWKLVGGFENISTSNEKSCKH